MQRMLNETKGTVVADRVGVASSFWSRFRGLMLKASLPRGEGLLIRPSSSIHTLFMRFPIDVVFLGSDGTVVKVSPSVRPYRATGVLRGGVSALELPAGTAAEAGVEPGDRLVFAGGDRTA